jgi:hypothetical protein
VDKLFQAQSIVIALAMVLVLLVIQAGLAGELELLGN